VKVLAKGKRKIRLTQVAWGWERVDGKRKRMQRTKTGSSVGAQTTVANHAGGVWRGTKKSHSIQRGVTGED